MKKLCKCGDFIEVQKEYCCRKCKNKRSKEWNHKNQEKRKYIMMNSRIKSLCVSQKTDLEKITPEFHQELLQKQNNCCAICKNPETYTHQKTGEIRELCVDHCHESGKIRGLLCSRCNHVLGHFNDSVDLFKSAITYLL